MISKIYEKTKKFISLNYKELIFLFVIFMTFPIPYYICVGGGTIDLGKRLEIEDSYQEKGSFNLAYVSELKANLPFYLLSFVIPSWERVEIETYQISEDETIEEITNRDRLYLDDSTQSAIYVAYTKAGKTFEITNHNYFIYFVDERANSNIMVGDILLSIDGIEEINTDKLRQYINSKNIGDEVTLKLVRNTKELELKTPVFEENGDKYVGVACFDILDYETDPKIELNFKESESGPSGGFTLALAIYNKLTKEDITNGKKIVGTGTIDLDGNIGEIGGVKYKLMGAVKKNADIFIVPNGSNYDECIKLKEEKKYKIEIIGVDNFDDALEKLSKIK